MAAVNKPLPQAPRDQTRTSKTHTPPDGARLSVEARAHLRQFIKHALAETSVDSPKEWATSIELALKELCASLSRGHWLSGARKLHEQAIKRRAVRETQLRKEQEKVERELEAKKKGKSKDEKGSTDGEIEKEKDNAVEERQKEKAKELSTEQRRAIALTQIQAALVQYLHPSPSDTPSHLLLMLSPRGAVLPLQDMDFDIFPSSKMCVFTSDRFILPSAEEMRQTTVSNFLYGLDEWDVDLDGVRHTLPRIVGGTFAFTGLTSTAQYEALSKVLKLSIFVCLSLILEQHMLLDSHVHLHFPAQPPAPAMTFSYTSPPPADGPGQGKKRPEKSRTGIWGYLAKKTGNLLGRNALEVPLAGAVSRSRSLESHSRNASLDVVNPVVDSLKGHQRRLSFTLHSSRSNQSVKPQQDIPPTFASALSRITASASILSSSAGVIFPPPRVLVALADREKNEPSRRLYGYEKVALASLLGWEGRDSAGRGMSGLTGFLRHQGITFLYAEYAPKKQEEQKVSASSSTQSAGGGSGRNSRVGTPRPSSQDDMPSNFSLAPCSKARWVTYRYYNRNYDMRKKRFADKVLGDAIQSMCAQVFDNENRNVLCDVPGCEASRADHRFLWIHNGLRITVEITRSKPNGEGSEPDSSSIFMWEACEVCQKTTERRRMSDGCFLFSFGKYLELLLYSPTLCSLSPRLCDHTTPPPHPWSPENSPPSSRFNIIRVFELGKCEIKFRTSLAPAMFDLRIPPLQILRGRLSESALSKVAKFGKRKSTSSKKSSSDSDEDKKALRKEIKRYWQGVSDHLDKLDERFSEAETFRKALPRLPSDYSVYGDLSRSPTPRATSPNLSASPATPSTIGSISLPEGEQTPTLSKLLSAPSYPLNPGTPKEELEPAEALTNLRYSFQREEQNLYSQLSNTPSANLNEVRRSFADASKGAALRLDAWEKKHCSETVRDELKDFQPDKPEWWKPGCHAVPGGSVIVREDELGSVIAFTLSSLDYVRELASMTTQSQRSETDDPPPSISVVAANSAPSSPALPAAIPTGRTKAQTAKTPDPDDDSAVWIEPEVYTSSIVRYDQPKDQSGLMSLREVLRNRKSLDPANSNFLVSSKFSPAKLVSAISGSVPTSPRVVSGSSITTPPSAWAEPAVEVSMQEAGGQVTGLPQTDAAEKILQGVEAQTMQNGSSFFPASWKNAFALQEPPRTQRPPSLISVESDYTTTTTEGHMTSSTTEFPENRTTQTTLTSVPEVSSMSDGLPTNSQTTSVITSSQSHPPSSYVHGQDVTVTQSTSRVSLNGKPGGQHQQSPTVATTSTAAATTASETAPSLTTTITATMTNAMRYLIKGGEPQRAASPAHHHKLLALGNDHMIIDRPHIKYEWTVGKRLRFGCTVYYAKQFEILRRRCGVDAIFTKSLERSDNWAAEGGKSRSNFWKTQDDRFVIKSLVNAWNVADLQVLIELAPSYFRYMESTSTRPSVIAKLLGFYTIEIKNLENGNVQSKADLLVMENVFYEQRITKTFDLKGIQGRRVKASGKSSGKKTLFDGDWLEDQRKALILLHPESKLILQEAIKADADFLSRNNIMDYSLLLGVDEERRKIACGLVDMIGSYTFAKTLEYKAKQNLISGKETTVIPPNEYHDRFVNAMNNYFLACPDKWTRPSFDSSDIDLSLPSVL